MAKPTLYTPELWASILAWLADGHALADWSRAEPGRPNPRTIREWAQKDAVLKAEYDAAFDEGLDAINQRARNTLRGKGPDEGGESTGNLQRDKAIAWYDAQLLGRWSARYRDNMKLEHAGSVTLEQLITQSMAKKPEDA